MEDALRIFGPVVLILIAGWVGQQIQSSRQQKDLKSLPDYEDRKRYVRMIREMRAAGESQKSVKAALIGEGLRKGVAEGLIIDVDAEEAPNLNEVQEYRWNQLSMDIPGNWRVDLLDDEIAESTAVTIESNSSAIVFLIDEASMEDVAAFEQTFEDMFATAQRELVEKYYNLPGAGYRISGMIEQSKMPGTIIVFRPELQVNADKLLIVDQIMEEDEELYTPGMNLIRNSISVQVHA